MANGQPKPIFYVAVFLVVAGLIGGAKIRYGAAVPGGRGGGPEGGARQESSWQAADVEQRVLENARVLWERSVEQHWHDAVRRLLHLLIF